MEPLFVGVMGYSGQKFDTDQAISFLKHGFDIVASEHPGRAITIVSGYTNLGIPSLAYNEAVTRGWKTVGVACKKAQEYECFPCDDVHIIGDDWGEESPIFLGMCQIFVRVGGGNQSKRETAAAKADGKKVIEYELEAISS